MLIKFIHAKLYANAIAIYNASKMNTHEFNKMLGFEAGAHSPFSGSGGATVASGNPRFQNEAICDNTSTTGVMGADSQ